MLMVQSANGILSSLLLELRLRSVTSDPTTAVLSPWLGSAFHFEVHSDLLQLHPPLLNY